MPLALSPKLIRDRIIIPVLNHLEPVVPFSVEAMELLLGTAAAESRLGYWLRQQSGGPAIGLYQMEPDTEWDIWNNYLVFQPKLRDKVRELVKGTNNEMENNHAYATAMARIHYRRKRPPLPAMGDIHGHAHYWKDYYNTRLGKGTPIKYLTE